MLFNLWDHLRQDGENLLGWPVAACAALGAVFAAFDARLRKIAPLWIAGALLYLSLVPAFYSERYGLALVPFYATLAACAMGSPLMALALGHARKFWFKPALALIPIFLAVRDMKKDVSDSLAVLPTEILDCARVLKPLAAPGDRLIARKAHLAYYSGLEMRMFPRTQTLPELAAFARTEKARWLYTSQPEASTRLQYNYLLDTTAAVPGLTPRFVSSGHPAVLYEIGPEFGRLPEWMANDTLVMLHRYRGMLALVPDDPHTLYTLGKLEHTRGRLQEAARYLARAEELNPKNARIPMALGDVELSAGRPLDAAAQFQRVEDLEPGNLQARLGRGWATLLAGKNREAAGIWRPVVPATSQVSVLGEMIGLYQSLGDSAAEQAARRRLAEVTR
jgi:tetratricopeptide (TPR) repeat protein